MTIRESMNKLSRQINYELKMNENCVDEHIQALMEKYNELYRMSKTFGSNFKL